MTRDDTRVGWQVVMTTQLRQIWLGWQGPLLLTAISLFMSVFVVALAANPEINVLSHRAMVDLTMQVTVLAGIVAVLVLGADSFSGERDHRTLESLLLTPVPRGQLVVGKLLAILSLWLGILSVAVPYIAVVSKGADVVTPSLLLLLIPGTLLVGLSAGVGVVISGLSPTNFISFTVAFAVMLALAAPTQLPGPVKESPLVYWFIVSNPFTAVASYQASVIGGDQAWTEGLGLLLSPLIAVTLAVGLGPRFLSRRLSLQGGLK